VPFGGKFILVLVLSLDSDGSLVESLRGYLIKGVILWAASFVIGILQGLRAQRLPVQVGIETMLGKTAKTLTPVNRTGGKVLFEGEYWDATSDAAIEKGQLVEIAAVEGLNLKVQRWTR
jgi:membrane-bound serine protease (ClpP class)